MRACDEVRKRGADACDIVNLNRRARAHRRHGERHRDTMIAVAVDDAAVKARGAAYPQSISQKLMLDAEAPQARSHGGQTVALLNAQLKGSAHQGLTLSAGSGDEEYRQLIDRKRHGGRGHFDAV